MKVIVLSATHRVGGDRGPIYQSFLNRMAHIRAKYGIEMLVVGSEGYVSKNMTVDSGAMYLEFDNHPLSNKWNAGMIQLRQHDPDYVMILGSDDFVSDALIEKYLSILSLLEYNIVGIADSYYASYNLKRAHFGQCLYWGGYPKQQVIGYGRCFGKEILDAVNWSPWPNGLNAGLDFNASVKIKKTKVPQRTFKFKIKDDDLFHIDIKTAGNISSLSPIVRRSTEINIDIDWLLHKHLPQGEADALIEYINELKLHFEMTK